MESIRRGGNGRREEGGREREEGRRVGRRRGGEPLCFLKLGGSLLPVDKEVRMGEGEKRGRKKGEKIEKRNSKKNKPKSKVHR